MNGCALSAERFQTVTDRPLASSDFAIAVPIWPSPRTEISDMTSTPYDEPRLQGLPHNTLSVYLESLKLDVDSRQGILCWGPLMIHSGL